LRILGLSAYYHDAAAALLCDGRVVAAAEQERFSRRKHDADFPLEAARFCLARGGLEADQLDAIAFYEKPLRKFDRLLDGFFTEAPRGVGRYLRALPLWLRQRVWMRADIERRLETRAPVCFLQHHESHAASAYGPSPFAAAAVLTLDGVGEWTTNGLWEAAASTLTPLAEIRYPDSLGLLYSAFTAFCGFKVNSGEHKLMGLAPYGEPVYADLIREKLVDVLEDGSIWMDQSYFAYRGGLGMTSRKLDALLGGPPRRPESPLTRREMDLAASIQRVTEEIMLRAARHLHHQTSMNNLCLAGGVALNCVANGRVLREGPFQRLWIQPAAGDAGGALGVALLIWHQLLGHERRVDRLDSQQGSLLGPRYSDRQVRDFLDSRGARYHYFEDEDLLCRRVAGLLASEKVVGWLQGRMEFGPRALGSRSILGDARSPKMQSLMNRKVKFRESFRPFAPAVLCERAGEYFPIGGGEESPYMLLVAPLAEEKRLAHHAPAGTGLERLNAIRSTVPAITHVDYSARVQTVDPQRHGRFYKLLKAFEAQTGCPMIVNTSFNVRGEPMVCAPEHAYRCFLATNLDVLVMERCVLYKEEQPEARAHPLDDYLAQFPLD